MAPGVSGVFAVLATTLLIANTSFPQQRDPVVFGSSCSALMGLGLPQTTITYTIRTYAGSFVLPGTTGPVLRSVPPFNTLPEFCRVTATLRPAAGSSIDMELWMPTVSWNGKFLAAGNTSPGRTINYTGMAAAVARGYATASTSAGNRDDAVHEMTVRVKRIVEAYFGREPWMNYLQGCGLGGRQGVVEAERYPEDFDGVIAGAPSLDRRTADLRKFTSTGGRLLLYHGTADPTAPPAATIDYFRAVSTADGADPGSRIRLFLLPDVAHCGGGEGPDTADFVSALEAWLEKNHPPDRILASRLRNGVADLTRPLCPYPAVATYSGAGSQNDAASFLCRTP
jgi:pimeloyl-ACP methyl ester carboxylesterase